MTTITLRIDDKLEGQPCIRVVSPRGFWQMLKQV